MLAGVAEFRLAFSWRGEPVDCACPLFTTAIDLEMRRDAIGRLSSAFSGSPGDENLKCGRSRALDGETVRVASCLDIR